MTYSNATNIYSSTAKTQQPPMLSTETEYKTSESVSEELEYFLSNAFTLYIPAIIFLTMLFVIGVPGNSIVVYIYFGKWGNNYMGTLILSLAVLDLTNCVLTLPVEIVLMSHPLIFHSSVLCKLSRFISYVCHTASAPILTAIAADRFQRVCKPLRRRMTSNIAKIIIFVSLGISVVVLSPALVLFSARNINKPGIRLNICSIDDSYLNTRNQLIFIIFIFVCILISILVMCTLYSIVGLQVCRHSKFRTRSRSRCSLSDVPMDEDNQMYLRNKRVIKSKEQLSLKRSKYLMKNKSDSTPRSPRAIRPIFKSTAGTLKKTPQSVSNHRVQRTSMMLFLVTLVYVVSQIPVFVMLIYQKSYQEEFDELNRATKMTAYVLFRFYLLNCAVNPIIYSFCNALFRKECMTLFGKIFGRSSDR